MQKLGPAQAPFQTSNAALAFALHFAGVPFHDPKHPCANIYTKDIVFTAGGGKKNGDGSIIRPSRYEGRDFDVDLVREVFNDGRGPKGQVIYAFQRTTNLGKLTKAFAAQEKACDETDFIGRSFILDTFKKIAANEANEAEGLVRIACVMLRLRRGFLEMWKKMIPQIQVDNPGQSKTKETARGTVVSHPGFRGASINANEAVRNKLKI